MCSREAVNLCIIFRSYNTSRALQEAQKQYLQRELSEGLLCAVINNNTRCYNESTEFADHIEDALAGPYKVHASRFSRARLTL